MPGDSPLAPVRPHESWTVFFDGDCALCHGFVKFVIRRDRRPQPIRFAPLRGSTFEAVRGGGAAWPDPLPDSLVMVDEDGVPHFRSDGVLRILAALGGPWRPLAAVGRLVPPPLRDFVYDRIAAVRKRVFGTTETACPVVPAEWSDRLLP